MWLAHLIISFPQKTSGLSDIKLFLGQKDVIQQVGMLPA